MPAIIRVAPGRRSRPARAFSLCLGAGLLAAAPFACAQSYRYVGQFGVSGPGTLNFPSELALDPATRNIYVSDTGNDRIVVFDAAGNYLSTFGSSGTADGEFDWPAGIAVDPVSHHVIVADYFGHRVQAFDANGGFLSKFGPNDTWNPCGLAVRPGNRDIVVSNGFGGSVLVYDVNAGYVGQFGSNFGYACDLTIAPNGDILVADETNDRVQRYDGSGSFLGQFGASGSGDGQMSGPGGVGIEPVTGNIVVVDASNNRIEIFDAGGNYLSQFGSAGAGPGQFNVPIGLAFDPVSHDLLVADRSNDRIQRFSSCGGTLVNLSVLPQTQALNQPVLFSASIGNVESPSGIVSMYADDGGLICTATTYGDPQAACSGNLALGMHAVTAVYGGNGAIPSGCSEAVVVTIVDDTMLTATNASLLLSPSDPSSWLQGKPITLTQTLSGGPGNAPTGPSAVYGGFVTFYDGSNVLAQVPLAGGQAQYTNAFAGGAHQFSAVYSGDGTHQTSSAGQGAIVAAPDDGVFYNGFEVPPGN